MTDTPTIQDIIQGYQAQIEAMDAAAAQRLVDAYQRAYEGLRVQQDALLQEIAAIRAAGDDVSAAQLRRMQRYQELLDETESAMQRYAAVIDDQVWADAPGAAQLGAAEIGDLLRAQMPPGPVGAQIMAAFQMLPEGSIEALVGALREDSPLWTQTLASFGAEAREEIAQGLVNAVLAGWNPRRTAREMTDRWGVPLTRALTISRTEHLRAHRMAGLATMRANAHVVRGWRWCAALDTRTCMSCVNLHGTEFGLDETMDDHVNGRCTMCPITVSFRELGLDIPDLPPAVREGEGREWFEALPESEQIAMMGAAKHAAWRAGAFEFSALTREVNDVDWGRTFVEASLKGILGEQAREYYGGGA